MTDKLATQTTHDWVDVGSPQDKLNKLVTEVLERGVLRPIDIASMLRDTAEALQHDALRADVTGDQ